MPHINEFSDDLFIRRIITRFAHATIFHSQYALNEAKELKFYVQKGYLIPHAHYSSSYDSSISKKKAKENLKIEQDEFVFLFFGNIKAYKGLDELLTSFANLLETNKGKAIRLVIAGKCEDDGLAKLIRKYQKEHSGRISLFLEYINDEKVQLFFNSADIVVLPFKKNTTSGSAILALTFGKPIIAPRLGNIIDLPDDTGYFYSADNNTALSELMLSALNNKDQLKIMGDRGKKYIEGFSWHDAAALTLTVYKNVLEKK
jgi:glycosyltransferase involved in cell wall biosynthesis